MPFQSLPVSGNTNITIADELGQRLRSLGGDTDCLEEGRLFVDKIIREAQFMKSSGCGKREDIFALVNRIKGTLDALEVLHREGLASPDARKKLLLAIVDMGQRFLSRHKEICQEAFDRALSRDV